MAEVTFPIPYGIRVKLRDGRIATTAQSNHDNLTDLIGADGRRITNLYRSNGRCFERGSTERPYDVVEFVLTLPLTVGQKVVCRDGTTRTVASVRYDSGHGCDVAKYDDYVVTAAASGECDTSKGGIGGRAHECTAVADAADWNPATATIDWDKPLIADFNGEVYRIKRLTPGGVSEDGPYKHGVEFEPEFMSPNGCIRGFRYGADGRHIEWPDQMPVIRNGDAPVVATPENPDAIDWSAPLEGVLNGEIIPVTKVEEPRFGREKDYQWKVTFDRERFKEVTHSHGFEARHYRENGRHKRDLKSMPVLRNVTPAQPRIRTRVRKPKPTVDQNFKELTMLLATMKSHADVASQRYKVRDDVNRANWLLKQIIQGLKTDQNIDGTVAEIYENARAEAQKVIDQMIKATEKDIASQQRDIVSQREKLANDRVTFAATVRDELARMDAEFEDRVKREVDTRVDQAMGRKSTITRKRGLRLADA